MKVLVVGQAPSQDTDGRAPFTGRSGRRLAELVGCSHPDLPRRVDLVNLLDRWPGKAGKGDRFPMREARASAAMLLTVAPQRGLVLCGGNVARAFGMRMEPLDRRLLRGRFVLLLPHPSGVNRWWNEPGHQEAARDALRSFLSGELLSAVG